MEEKKKAVALVSTGSWSSALANVLADNGHDVLLWGRNPREVEEIDKNHTNSRYFEAKMNPSIRATTDFSALNGFDTIVLATPTSAMKEMLQRLYETLDHPVILINVSKGFHPETGERLSVAIKNVLKEKVSHVVSLIGPSHAEEVVIRKITVVNSVCEDEEAARFVQTLFANDYFRVYRNTDVIGAELAAATKNVMAIASGMLEGLGEGDNARAALITRGLAEIARFVTFYHGKRETLLGLNGVGDLIVTCSSRLSRNFQAGEIIGKADGAEEFLETNTKTVESINTSRVVYMLAKKNNISMPITEEVYRVLYEDKKPSVAMRELLRRELKREFV